jgi:hypothetical protein
MVRATPWIEAVKSFRRAGLDSVVSYHYRAGLEGPTREIDVFAWRRKVTGDAEVYVSFVVEAKSSAEKPWVLLLDQPDQPPSREIRYHATLGSRYAAMFYRALRRRKSSVADEFLLSTPASLAHGLRTAFSDTDVAYQAVQSAVSAALAQLTEPHHVDTDFPVAAFVYPVVLLDAPLIEFWLDDLDQPRVKEVASGTLFWPSPEDGRPVLVEVVTRAALHDWLGSVKASLDALMADCDPELALIAARWEQDRTS